jgi:hypothetical protein
MPGQATLFDLPATAAKRRRPDPEPIVWPGGVRPWDPIDEDDFWLGVDFPWITPRRARDVRLGR